MAGFIRTLLKQYRCKHVGTETTLHTLEANRAALYGDTSKLGTTKSYSVVCLQCLKVL